MVEQWTVNLEVLGLILLSGCCVVSLNKTHELPRVLVNTQELNQ